MERELLQNAEKFHRKRHRRKRWQKVVSTLGCVVVFCVTYALVLPAVTQEKETFCGKQEHTHADSCYSKAVTDDGDVLVCTLTEAEPHTHGEACYELQGDHTHTEACFLRERGALICELAEEEGHSHGETCYAKGVLLCTAQEGHLHSEGCYSSGGMVCAIREMHVHGNDCYVPGALICATQTDHVHGNDCYTDGALTCTEQENHAHGDLCYGAPVMACTEQENHVHGDGCYGSPILTCTEPENHFHDDSCYDRSLVCQIPEMQGHTHQDDCYEMLQTMTCTLEETPGIQVLICTAEEVAEGQAHVHGEACYIQKEEVLTCELQEDDTHTHGERCYGIWELTCGQEVHTHDLTCSSNPNADVEAAADWEKTFADVELTGRWDEDVLAIAQSQMGYSESRRNYIVAEDTTEIKGYTRYGAWYGNRYGDWCAMFVSFCLHYAEVDREVFPNDSSCSSWCAALDSRGMYRLPASYTPVPGDLIFFDWDADGSANHVGLVKAYDPETGEITTIEGNRSNSVANFTYKSDDSDILSYGVLPENPANASYTLKEQVLTAVIYTDGTYTQSAEDATVITVSGLLPEGAEARAYPVTLEESMIEGRPVILAYDISVFYGDGQLFEQTDTPLNVAIRPADWEETAEEETNYNVYYIPEEGEPQPMDTAADEEAVNFQTDHFSTYALTAGGTSATVYLNGATGDDTRAGTSANTAVKTLEKAMALVRDGGTIYISGTVTVSDSQLWDLDSKVTVKRYSSFTGPLITVADGGSLTLSNITINGGSGKPAADEPDFNKSLSSASPDIATNTTYASGSAKAPLIVINNGGRVTIQTGAVLEYNSNKPNTSSGYFAQSGYIGLGGAVYCSGTLTMTGGTIRYCEAQSGGGVYLDNGAFYMNDGLIDHNYARDIEESSLRYGKNKKYHQNAGGGVYVGEYSTMVMSGGTISYNQSSREGGGISLGWLNRNNGAYYDDYVSTFTMNGGTITHNTATSTGGGLNITAGYQAFINAGSFTYNVAYGDEYQPGEGDTSVWSVYSGGAIYVDASGWDSKGGHKGVPGKAVINRAIITQNTAINGGGGIAACQTSTNFVYGDATNGTAIYANKRFGGTSSNELYISSSAGQTISDRLLGNGRYNWTKSGTTYTNALTEQSAAVKTARSLATVFITNNYAHLGGGIGCNGLIEVGGEKHESTYINIKKVWDDDGTIEHPEYIDVQILQDGKPYGEPIRIYRTYDANGNEIWPTFYQGGLPSGHTYTIKEIEVPGYEASISQTGQDFIITNKPTGFQVVKKWVDESGNAVTENLPGSITVQLYQNGVAYGDPVELNAGNSWTYTWLDLPKNDDSGNPYTYTAKEIVIPDGFYSGESQDNGAVYEITNIKSPVTSVSVEKQWVEGTPVAEVTVQLKQNGVPYRDPVTLNEANGWFHKWENLPTKDKNGNDVTYTVAELNADGYDVTIADGVRSEIPKIWTVTSSLESGNTYLLVSGNGALAADSNGLRWVDVSSNLADGTLPETAAQWAFSNSTLRSNSGSYLAYDDQAYRVDTSGTSLSIADGYISYSTGVLFWKATYYFGNSITNGTANAPTAESDAATFTFYKQIDGEDPCANWGDAHFVVTNALKKPTDLEVKFAKYSDGVDTNGNPTLLAGAELELYKEDPAGDVTIPGTEVKGVLLRRWTSEAASPDNPEGIRAETLLGGTYYLVETKTPDGHAGLTGPIVFQVDAEAGTATITDYPDRPGEEGVVEGVFPIYNAVMVTLPETGGPGTFLYTAGGLLLLLCAGFLLVYNQLKCRKEETGISS